MGPFASIMRGCFTSWRCTHRFRLKVRSPGSSPAPRPIRAEFTWRRLSAGLHNTWLANCSSCMAGVVMVRVPYRGAAPALTDVIGGQVEVMFANMPSSLEYKGSKLRALAVTTATCSEALPDIPSVDDFVPGFAACAQFGLGSCTNTRVEVIAHLNHELAGGLTDPKMKARLADLAGSSAAGWPADFRKLIADETEKWGKVVKFSGA